MGNTTERIIIVSKRVEEILHETGDVGYLHLHPNWSDFIHYCSRLRFGEIQSLKIQDGIPMVAEIVKHKINFSKNEGRRF